MKLFKQQAIEPTVFSIEIIDQQPAPAVESDEHRVDVHPEKNLFSLETELLSQAYEKSFVLITVYNSEKIEFTVNAPQDDHLKTLVFTNDKALADNGIKMRVALYDNIDAWVVMRNILHPEKSASYASVTSLLMAIKHNAYSAPFYDSAKQNMSTFCDLLKSYKQEELRNANEELQTVMKQHDKKHDCFGYEENPSVLRSYCAVM